MNLQNGNGKITIFLRERDFLKRRGEGAERSCRHLKTLLQKQAGRSVNGLLPAVLPVFVNGLSQCVQTESQQWKALSI